MRLNKAGFVRSFAFWGLLIATALLPHLGAVAPGRTYFYRDFGLAFYPFRHFVARELARGTLPFWNPYIQEGIPWLLPFPYPVDLLHALWPGPAAVSWLLMLHFPLAAVTAAALARALGVSRAGAYVSGAVYAMGGLALASLNLYVFLQSLALVPLIVLFCYRAAGEGGRFIPAAGLIIAVSLTTGQEFSIQGVLAGIVLGLVWDRRNIRAPAVRIGFGVALGVGLAGSVMVVLAGAASEMMRGTGLTGLGAVQFEVHPATLVRVLIRDFFGTLESPMGRWWGHRFFASGFPYFISLYLGPPTLALACAGLGGLPRRRRCVLIGLAGLGLWYALGSWGGLAPALASWPVFRSFRFPVKTVLLPYLVAALLAGRGTERLLRGDGWNSVRLCGLVSATFALGLAAVAALRPEAIAAWMGVTLAAEPSMRPVLSRECAGMGILSLGAVILAVARQKGWLRQTLAASVLGAVAVLDLARAGAGINPQTEPSFFARLPGVAALHLDEVDGGRVFSYGITASPAFKRYANSGQQGVLVRALYAKRQVLSPFANVLDRVEGGPILDPAALMRPPELRVWEWDVQYFAQVLPRLRNAAVVRVLSFDPIDHADLKLMARVPVGVGGLDIHAYEVVNPWPRVFIGCRVLSAPDVQAEFNRPFEPNYDPNRDVALEEPGRADCNHGSATYTPISTDQATYRVESDGQGYLVMRDSYARGWAATVDGLPARVLRANGKHRAVAIGSGVHEVVLRYHPPGLRAGLLVSALSVVAALVLWVRPFLQAAPPQSRI